MSFVAIVQDIELNLYHVYIAPLTFALTKLNLLYGFSPCILELVFSKPLPLSSLVFSCDVSSGRRLAAL